MKRPIDLSPLGTALVAVADEGSASTGRVGSAGMSEVALLDWLGQLGEALRTRYNLEEETVFIAWELARWQPGLKLIERQALILLILSTLVHLWHGSTRITIRDDEGQPLFLDLAGELLTEIQPSPGIDGIEPNGMAKLMEQLVDSGRLSAIIGGVNEFKPLIVTGRHLYLQKMLHLEDRFVAALRRRLAGTVRDWSVEKVEQALSDVLARPVLHNGESIELKDEQQAAVCRAVQNSVTIISGGPGTGKTTIIVSILRVLRRLGVTCEEIALAAPTGKAANRIGEAIRASREEIAKPTAADRDLVNLSEPRTLHRLLGFSPGTGRFLHHENCRLAERVVIVDEGSMIDLSLMERLIRSLRDDSLFILLGDAHQLPSVEAGAVLRDLLADDEGNFSEAMRSRGVRLSQSYRMRREDDNGRNILTVAQAIDRGIVPNFAPTRRSEGVVVERSSISGIAFQGVEFLAKVENSDVLDRFLAHWHKTVVWSRAGLQELVDHKYTMVEEDFDESDQNRLRELFAHWEGFRILCVTRVSTGSDHVNAVLHQHALDQRTLDQNVSGLLASPRDDDLIAGEPVMMQVNDYNRMLFNGDQGLILKVTERGRTHPMAVFRQSQGFVAFHLESLRPVLVHSYAMTVHKAQGSEFDQVALVLPDSDLPINTREILYTALTRSRASVVIVGSRGVFESGIAKIVSRDSGITEKLRGGPAE
jgi:exodeoxyribonuclease V alpha subunit